MKVCCRRNASSRSNYKIRNHFEKFCWIDVKAKSCMYWCLQVLLEIEANISSFLFFLVFVTTKFVLRQTKSETPEKKDSKIQEIRHLSAQT